MWWWDLAEAGLDDAIIAVEPNARVTITREATRNNRRNAYD
jgi:hypothetical protein